MLVALSQGKVITKPSPQMSTQIFGALFLEDKIKKGSQL